MTQSRAVGSGAESSAAWERAYLRFETPAQERRKFTRRLRRAGAERWPRDAIILDLFSGRGGGADALRDMGFSRVIGLDLSVRLLRAREGAGERAVADCRALPLASHSIDVAVVHGGLHHLPRLTEDLALTLQEVVRALKPDGLFMAVEPWRTSFLDVVHWLCGRRMARRACRKIDALATMIEHERTTYDAWLSRADEVLQVFDRYFIPRQMRIDFGKLHYVGVPR